MELLGRVPRIERLLEVRRLDVLRPHGLTTADIDVLASLWRHPDGQRPRDLRRTMMVGSGTLTPRLDRLEAGGMARAPAGPRGSPRLRAGAHRKRATPCSTAHRAAARGRESSARCTASNRGRATRQGPRQPALFTRARRHLALAGMTVTWAELTSRVEEVASDWRAARPERQARRNLDPADFARLVDAGFLRVAVPEEQGGLWRSVAESTRPVAETLRTLAGADPSVALVSSMHPAVLGFWLARPDPARSLWTEQRDAVFASAANGSQWGTITSEPGSGGDILRTKSQAHPDDGSSGPSARAQLPRQRRQALRQRLGRHRVHDHDRGAGG